MTDAMTDASSRFFAARVWLIRTPLFAALWWVLAEGESRAWGVGAFSVLAAVAASAVLWPSTRLGMSPLGLLGFLGFFLWQTLRGGVAVAALAMRPRLRLRPEVRAFALRLPPGAGRVLLADTLSLLPGTVSAGLSDDVLLLHVLDRDLVNDADMRAAEDRVARLLGLELAHG